MIKAVIFDMDGVLVHTDQLHYAVWCDFTRALGIPFSPAVMDRIRGLSRADCLDIVLSSGEGTWSREERAAMAEEKNRAYIARVEQMTPADVDEPVRQALAGLRARGVLLAVGSSSTNAPLVLERTGLAGEFDVIVDGNMIQRAKPDPEVFLTAARRLGVAPASALVVEDGESGIRAAHAGGFPSAAFGGSAETCPLADYHIREMTDLLELI